MQAWTAEPWRVVRHGYAACYQHHESIDGPNGGTICAIWNPPGNGEQTANSARIVATINACAGVPNLSPGVVADLIYAVKECVSIIRDLVHEDAAPKSAVDVLDKLEGGAK